MKNNKSGFSLIEVLVSVAFFAIGITAVFNIFSSSVILNNTNKNSIIASNLAREGLELITNLRDSNYQTLHNWNSVNPNQADNFSSDNFFTSGNSYTIELDYETNAPYTIEIKKIEDFVEESDDISVEKMQSYNLCLNSQKKYTYNCDGNESTIFYRYIKIEDLKYTDSSGTEQTVEDAYLVTSKVIWVSNKVNVFELTTILSDYKI